VTTMEPTNNRICRRELWSAIDVRDSDRKCGIIVIKDLQPTENEETRGKLITGD